MPADFEDLRDVGMTQRRGRFSFAHERSSDRDSTRRQREESLVQLAIEFGVLRQIDLAHSAFANFRDDSGSGESVNG